MASLARIEGKPKLSMASQMISGVSNIILDYIFIVPLHWGVFGAALATIIGQFIGFAILFWFFFLSGKSILRFTVRHLFVKFTTAKQICAIGTSGFFMQIGGSITFAFFLTYLGKYGGDPAISAMGAATGLATLAFMPLLGLQQGLGPIIGYNHGMKRHDRVRRTLALGIIWGIILAAIASLFVEIFPQLSASLFINSDSPTMAICIRAIRICFIMVPLLSIYTISSGYFQSTAQPLKAFVLSICRQPLFMVPCLLIIPLVLGLDGVWLSMTVSDFLAILLAIILLIHSGAMIKSHEDEQLKIPLTAPVLET
jgi:Na+-driven multidrug efflux pump